MLEEDPEATGVSSSTDNAREKRNEEEEEEEKEGGEEKEEAKEGGGYTAGERWREKGEGRKVEAEEAKVEVEAVVGVIEGGLRPVGRTDAWTDGKTDRTGDRSLRAAHARGMRRLGSPRYNKYRIGSDRIGR